jgi:hypothetical protein
MKASKTVLLLLLVLGLGGYIWFYEMHQMSTHERLSLERQAFDLPVEQIVGIGIKTREYEVDLQKTEQGWELLHPKGARAGTPVVKQLLARFKNLGRGELITPADMRERELTLADFGLPVPQLILRLETAGENRVYHVGDPNPLGNAVYVKEVSSQNVMLISSDLLDVLPEDLAAYRDKTLFPLHFEEVQALDFIDAARTLRLEKLEGGWVFKKPVNAKGDQEKITELIQKLLQARIDGVVNDPSEEELANFAASEKVVRIWSVNSKVPVEVVVGGDLPLDPDFCYLRIVGQEGLVVVSKGMRNLAQTPVASLRNRRLFAADPQNIQAVSLQRDLTSLRLEKKGNEWWVVDPVNMKASSARVQSMIKNWQEARVEFFKDQAIGGVATLKVSFEVDAAQEPQTVAFEVMDGGAVPGRALLRKDSEEGLLQVLPDLVKFTPVEVLPYLSREVLSFDPKQAVRLSLSIAEKSFTFVRKDPGEAWTSQNEAEALDQAIIEGMIKAFSTVFAESLVELNPADLSVYGLDQPRIRLSVGLAGEEAANRTMLISLPGNDASPVGILQGQNLVFKLAPAYLDIIRNPVLQNP